MNEDTCVACGRYIPEGYGHVCTECLDKSKLRVNANIRLPKPEETLTITLKYSGGQLTAETRNPLPGLLSRIVRWVKGGRHAKATVSIKADR